MTIATMDQLKDQLAFTGDEGELDDALLARLIPAAQGHVERLLGFKIEVQFGGAEQEPVPEPLVHAVLMLAAHWYEVREASHTGLREVPFGVTEIVTEYRGFTF